jgi:hypothetical protein
MPQVGRDRYQTSRSTPTVDAVALVLKFGDHLPGGPVVVRVAHIDLPDTTPALLRTASGSPLSRGAWRLSGAE